MIRRPPRSTLFPTRRSSDLRAIEHAPVGLLELAPLLSLGEEARDHGERPEHARIAGEGLVEELERGLRSEEHTPELQSRRAVACRLLHAEQKNECGSRAARP